MRNCLPGTFFMLLHVWRCEISLAGITNLKFKPAYNPYTEPSMEIFGFSPELKRWIEIGNSGMFRPEMLRPMGLPEDVQVRCRQTRVLALALRHRVILVRARVFCMSLVVILTWYRC
jgi:hypothetical protein